MENKFCMNDEFYMKIAINEAKISASKNEIPIGAVLVDESGFIVTKNHNLVETLKDSTAHAEILAIQSASKILGLRLNNLTMYVNLEPCAMCAGALILARINRLVYATPSPYGAVESLFNITNNKNLNHQIKITAGCLENESKFLLKKFFESRR